MAIQNSSIGCQRATWEIYINTIGLEAETDSINNQKVDTTLRPFLRLNPAALTPDSLQAKTPEEEKKQSSFAHFTMAVVDYIFKAQLEPAQDSATKTAEYRQHALVLLSWHMELSKITSPLTSVSADIDALTKDVYAIDKIRVHQAHDRFRVGVATLLGSVIWITGACVPARWMAIVGKVILAGSALYYGVSWLYHRRDQKKMTDLYAHIRELAGKIQRALPFYDENMRLQDTPQQKYEPSRFEGNAYPDHETLKKVLYIDFTQKHVQ